MACSTCHVILDDSFYKKLPEPSDDENDMLDLAFGLTDTSRLGCQVKMTSDIDGIVVKVRFKTSHNSRYPGQPEIWPWMGSNQSLIDYHKFIFLQT